MPPAGADTASTRPHVHFTADRGWVNDPHGIVWSGGQYHLFHQAVPGSTSWSSRVLWGHAVSPDLVHWQIRPPALTPGPDEQGCWSGASVVTDTGELDLFYTRVQEQDLGDGVVVRARPDDDGERWAAEPDRPLVTAPVEVGARSFRDPCIFRFEDHWVMVVGAALPEGRAALLHYVSDDLSDWTYTGVAASRPTTAVDPVWTGSMWECPQLFEVDGTWVLLVSVWADGTLHDVAAATGSYDGRVFVPHDWQQLTSGSSAYAMTSFADRDGRPCVMSWLREGPGFDASTAVRAGALSLSCLVTVDRAGVVRLALHPDLDRLRQEPALDHATGEDLSLVVGGATDVEVQVGDQPARLTVTTADRLLLDRPIATSSRVVLDTDIVEICGPDGLAVHRLGRASGDLTITVTGAGQVRAWALTSPWRLG